MYVTGVFKFQFSIILFHMITAHGGLARRSAIVIDYLAHINIIILILPTDKAFVAERPPFYFFL